MRKDSSVPRLLLVALLVLSDVLFAHAFITKQEHWKRSSAVAGEQEHTVIFALRHKDGAKAQGDRILEAIHDPAHEQYGKHLSIQEMQEIFIDEQALDHVTNYLNKRGISHVVRGDFIFATSDTATWEELLQTKFYHFEHVSERASVVRSLDYTVPAEVSSEVAAILLTQDLPPIHSTLRTTNNNNKRSNTKRETSLNPADLYKLYGVPNVDLSGPSYSAYSKGISQGILSASGAYNPSDLQLFKQNYGVAALAPVTVFSYQPYNATRCQDPTFDCGEPTLDLEWSMAMAPGVNTLFFNSLADGLAESFNYLAHNSSAPQVFSISLGVDNPSQSYINTLCGQAQMASLVGRTILAASGDASAFYGDCSPILSFPCACDYVTAVGGTQGPENMQPEVEWSASGAGYSKYVPIPNWQKPLVYDYISQIEQSGVSYPALNTFNSSGGRVYPDVAAAASNLHLYVHGKESSAAGTSFASPIFAGILTQLNVLRAKNGLGTIGQLNLALASLNRQAHNPLNDITGGASTGNCGQKLPAIVGWDIGTGFGAPNFANMVKYLVPYQYSTDSCANNTCAYPGGVCTVQGSSYTCACANGYVGNGYTCKVNDPCANSSNVCAASGKLCVSSRTEFHCCVAAPFFNSTNFAKGVTPFAITTNGNAPFQPKVVNSFIQIAATGATSEASAVWSTDAICTSFLTSTFYARYRFNWTGDANSPIDATSFIFQADGLNAIGSNAGSGAFNDGNITTGFAIKLNFISKTLSAIVLLPSGSNTVSTTNYNFNTNTLYTVEINYSSSSKTYSITSAPGNTVTTSFSADFSSIFSGKQIVYVGAGAGTGGFSGNIFVKDVFVGASAPKSR